MLGTEREPKLIQKKPYWRTGTDWGSLKTNRGVELEEVSQPSCSEKTIIVKWMESNCPVCSSEFSLGNEEDRLPMCGGPSSWRAPPHSSFWQRGYPQLSTPDLSLEMTQKGNPWTSRPTHYRLSFLLLKRVQQSTNGLCAYLSRVLTDFRASCSTALPVSENMEGAHIDKTGHSLL